MKKHKTPTSPLNALKASIRQEEIDLHGKLISFRKTITKNKKKYSRKEKYKSF